MSFDKTQIEALRESGAIFRAAPEAVAARFYLLLFEANPELRRLFPLRLGLGRVRSEGAGEEGRVNSAARRLVRRWCDVAVFA